MKSFKFRLAAALQHRELLLEVAQSELAQVLEKLELAQSLVEECRKKVKTYVDAAPRAGSQFDAPQELIRQRHIYQLHEEVDRRQAIVKQLDEARQAKVDAVGEAHRNLRALEILEEKERAAWLLEYKRNEQKELDEFSNRDRN